MTKFAMIGAGRIAATHARSFQDIDEAELIIVADPFAEAAQRIAAKTGAKASSDALGAIRNPDVEAVLICSPTATHVDLIRAAVDAGKAVLCEKPVDLDLGLASQLEASVPKDARVMMGFNRRFDPSFAQVNARVQKGELGKLEQVVVISRDPAPQSPEYVKTSGGIFKDMTIHDFDMVRFFLPDIVEVEAMGQNVIDPALIELEDFDGVMVTLRSASGAMATIINSRRAVFGYDQRLEVFGERGMLQAHNQLPTSVRSYGADHAEQTETYLHFFLQRYREAYACELKAFVDTLNGGGSFSPSLSDGVAALRLAVAAMQSARSGRRVEVASV
ncbi:myo-inositol 2-dehydrogenase / D-chiro-inositol 1-dehydrogenase [Tessaracoccus bendigoensis DSM 12906]|uniref:Myo-inositol 2-dehydrogenase / D-chiro-inositol 1-dehydrogenase n=1 Tax=Tessaracoccus bendigoensis DSM 12906 TaxID=1123357 RepID=A0A1M6I341_9ACTN|nr:inositol 2-dehydrogenase [Tessaracoccus bendigoensis]SHJ28840.1 myo-inositol 2-dehydrogenase / D-chiro-inositol 1-dehydrogenase [Tessaracoccus bendigoensis DSM 12906]